MSTHFDQTALESLVSFDAQLTQLLIEQNATLQRIATALENLTSNQLAGNNVQD